MAFTFVLTVLVAPLVIFTSMVLLHYIGFRVAEYRALSAEHYKLIADTSAKYARTKPIKSQKTLSKRIITNFELETPKVHGWMQ